MNGISVIICSTNKNLRESIKSNIPQTIGVPFEIICWDNTIAKEGLCSVYNKCAGKAKYSFLCFLHEDVIVSTQNWGAILIEKARNPEVGVIGFAGSKTLSKMPYGYWEADKLSKRYHLLQSEKDGTVLDHQNINRCDSEPFSELLVLDGFFLFLRKKIWDEVKFDAHNFPYFHYYDIDYTFNVAMKYKNYICYTIDIHHLSPGNVDISWFDSAFIFCDKWKTVLPKSLDPDAYSRLELQDKESFQPYIKKMVKLSSLGLKNIYIKGKYLKKEARVDYCQPLGGSKPSASSRQL
jgi:hypothetical protein